MRKTGSAFLQSASWVIACEKVIREQRVRDISGAVQWIKICVSAENQPLFQVHVLCAATFVAAHPPRALYVAHEHCTVDQTQSSSRVG